MQMPLALGVRSGDVAPAPPMVALQELATSAGNARNMANALWSAEFFDAYAATSLRKRQKIVEGLSKGAGLALLAIPTAKPFHFHGGSIPAHPIKLPWSGC